MKDTYTKISMGSSIIDLYMEGYDEGKNDDIQAVDSITSHRPEKNMKARVSSRRKKSYYKAKRRMEQLNQVCHYTPSPECEDVVFGMLRSHQLPLSDPILTCGCSIGDKKRMDAAESKMDDAMSV